jgi:hypothetical protein
MEAARGLGVGYSSRLSLPCVRCPQVKVPKAALSPPPLPPQMPTPSPQSARTTSRRARTTTPPHMHIFLSTLEERQRGISGWAEADWRCSGCPNAPSKASRSPPQPLERPPRLRAFVGSWWVSRLELALVHFRWTYRRGRCVLGSSGWRCMENKLAVETEVEASSSRLVSSKG